ncbi:MAG: cytochrome D1 domain-containing protein, partial [Caldimonas sp.]
MPFTPLRFLAAAVLGAAASTAGAAPFAYVPNEGSGTLSVIDTATDQVVGEIAVGQKPRGTVVSPDGRTAYVSDQPAAALVVVDLASRKRSGTIGVGASPEGVGISVDGRWVVAAVEETNEVVFVDTRTNARA